MIELVKPNPPNEALLKKYLEQIRSTGFYTNNGPLVLDLESKLAQLLQVKHLLYTSNGTLSLQLALRAFAERGEVVTTPYSYVATANSALWQGLDVKFVDIQHGSLFPDPDRLFDACSERTKIILLTHVYGFCGPLEAYAEVAKAKNVHIIYDAAHAFGVKYQGMPIGQFGDASCYSFHATKTFHTVEGGGIAVGNDELKDRLFHYRSFGHRGDEYFDVGINAKNSEVHAAFGLAQLDDLELLLSRRKFIYQLYNELFDSLSIAHLSVPSELEWNYGYYPLFFDSNLIRERFREHMISKGIMARRYFYPSLNTLPQYKQTGCDQSESLADRVVCIPIHGQLSDLELHHISDAISSFFAR